MSCDHSVWFPHKRLSNAEAGALYAALCDGDTSGVQAHPAIDAFYEELVPFVEVASILQRYGTIDRAGDHLEFTPKGDNLCEVGFVGGDEESGIDSIGFERPISGGALGQLIFELLSISGMCYFELDCTYVLAKTDVTKELPEGLLEQCSSGCVTVISSAAEAPL
jgi:hypothetical protein